MIPGPGERLVRFVGDQLSFGLSLGGGPLPEGWQARLRTNLGRGETLRREIIHAHTGRQKLANASWRDVPMASRDPFLAGPFVANWSLRRPNWPAPKDATTNLPR